jgi:hypothetical protein
MIGHELRFKCENCGEDFASSRYFKLKNNGDFVGYKVYCQCGEGVLNDDGELPVQKGRAHNPLPTKRAHRERAPLVPAGLNKLLDKEAELRRQNQEEKDDGEDALESSATEGDGS